MTGSLTNWEEGMESHVISTQSCNTLMSLNCSYTIMVNSSGCGQYHHSSIHVIVASFLSSVKMLYSYTKFGLYNYHE